MKSKLINTTTGNNDPAENGPQRCAECGTSDTPLWRLGPSGPKTMCNACGIRWKRQNTNNGKKKRKIKSKSSTILDDDDVDVMNLPLSPDVEKRNVEASSPVRPEGSSPVQAGTYFVEETEPNPNLIITEIDYSSLIPSDGSSEGLQTSEPSEPESFHSDGSLFEEDDHKEKRPSRKRDTKRRRDSKKTTKKKAKSENQLRKHSFFNLASEELDKLVEAAETDRRIIELEERISVMQQENNKNKSTIQHLMKELDKKEATIQHLLSSVPYMAPSGASPTSASYLPPSPPSSSSTSGFQTYWEPAKSSRNQISVQNLLT